MLREEIKEKKSSKSLKIKTNSNKKIRSKLILIQIDMTHLIFKRVSVKFEVRREKRGRKKKFTAWHFQYHHERWHLTIRKSQTRYRKSVGASHLLAFVACASNFYFLIIFIFVKRLNYSLKSIITKKKP